jgi:hypothetical protein
VKLIAGAGVDIVKYDWDRVEDLSVYVPSAEKVMMVK